jgi:peptide/nickel transport system substrate-binding protein
MTTSSRYGESSGPSANNTLTRRDLLATAAFGAIAVPGMAFAGAPQGQLTLALHVSLAPTWFDPAETQALITPFMVLYALQTRW